MSTDRKTKNTGRTQTLHRFSQIAVLGEVIFHDADLASLWQIREKNTLYTTLSRYTRQKLLYRLWRGMYALKPAEKIDPLFLGIKALHSFAYVSTETVLFRAGLISQRPMTTTLISGASRRFDLGGNSYLSRKLADQFLFQAAGISEVNGVREATSVRAAADLLYFNPLAHFDVSPNWKAVQRLQKIIGYPLTPERYQ